MASTHTANLEAVEKSIDLRYPKTCSLEDSPQLVPCERRGWPPSPVYLGFCKRKLLAALLLRASLPAACPLDRPLKHLPFLGVINGNSQPLFHLSRLGWARTCRVLHDLDSVSSYHSSDKSGSDFPIIFLYSLALRLCF